MSHKLMIVESKGKIEKLSEILGPDWKVMASFGHIRDLPDSGKEANECEVGIGHDLQLRYVVTERAGATVSALRAATKTASEVYIASDPDREGEAIAWHLRAVLNLRAPRRVTFQEITKSALQEALRSPRDINMDLVRAQEARRAVDRIIGYGVTSALGKQAGQKRSAGRVQSPALRLTAEREVEIGNFKPVSHFGATLSFDGWKAEWNTKPFLAEGQAYFFDKVFAERVAAIRDVSVLSCVDDEKSLSPKAPFITSTLQVAASTLLKIRPKRTMEIAQSLYEQGAITYMRTDSTAMSGEALAELRELATARNWPMVGNPRTWKNKANAQEAHECIRPTNFANANAGTTEDEKKLYRLIFARAVASQMEDAKYRVRTATLRAPLDGKEIHFVASGKTQTFAGWQQFYAFKEQDEGESTDEQANPIPWMTPSQRLTASTGALQNKKTKAPPRYTEASLIKALENLGIGRPATYSATLETLFENAYITTKEQFIFATELGIEISNMLVGRFHFVEYDYTAAMENSLDEIATGKSSYSAVVGSFQQEVEQELAATYAAIKPKHPCPKCGAAMSKRKGTHSAFWGCTTWHETGCDATLPDINGVPGERTEQTYEHHCPKCNSGLRRNKGKSGKSGNPYDFWGCTNRECKFTADNQRGKPKLN